MSTFSLSRSQNWHLYLQDLLELGNQCVSERFCLVLAGDFELSLWGVQLRLISKLLSWREKDWIANLNPPIPSCPAPLPSFLSFWAHSWIVESKAVLNFIQFQGQSVLRRACPGWCQKLQLLPVLFPILLVQNPRIHAYFTPDSFSSLISYQWPHSFFLAHCSMSKKGTVWIS